MTVDVEKQETPQSVYHLDRVFALAEYIIYVGISVLLFATGVVLLAIAAKELLEVLDQFEQSPIVEALDVLLLLFVVVELLSAVRTTIVKRTLVAEPFLLVGIIASIKEIVVLSIKAADNAGRGPVFRDQLMEIGVLGGAVAFLGITAWLLRIKEREPAEGS